VAALHGRFGDAFGIPFAIEGLFFFLEAIFLAIYIYGWKRLKPWPHFWTGVPIVIAGIGGTRSVVAANAWMNEPSGFTLNSAGKVIDVDPWAVIFNSAMAAADAPHARRRYPGGGFWWRRCMPRDVARPTRPLHRLGFIIAFTVAAVATPIQMLVGDELRALGLQQRTGEVRRHRDGAKTASDVPETLLAT